jgi:molecular chaperone GrpE
MAKEKKVKSEQPEWQIKAEEYLVGWQRCQADFVNFKNRSEEERKAFIQFANTDLIMTILPVLDNFKRAAQHAPSVEDASVKNWTEGIKAIEKQFEAILAEIGVAQISANPGDAFDPNIHDAMVSETSDLPEGTIISEIEPGYLLNNKVLRASKVSVSKGK